MNEGGEESCEAIDRTVLTSLRELQEEGDPDIIAEVGGLFLKHSPEKIAAIMKAAENGDAKGLQMAAHSLKSSSAYVGAMRLSAMSKELEQMGRSQIMDGANEKAKRLSAEYSRVMTALEAEIEQSTATRK
ncbi:Hpt domain protein [uncultured archaeon]|nr:Hpt domain protein [uncultured archaeon]